MSCMKKVINSLVIIILISFLFLLSSCNKEEETIIIYKKCYNVINDNLKIECFTKNKNNAYLNNDNITNAYIKTKEETIIVSVLDIVYENNDKLNKYYIIIDTSIINNELTILKDPVIHFEYINGKILKIKLSNIVIYNIEYENNINISFLKGVINNNSLIGIVFEFQNQTNDLIQIKDIKLINAYFKAIFDQKKILTNKDFSYEEIKNSSIFDQSFINVKSNESIVLYIPVEIINLSSYETGILIKYEMGDLIKNQIIKNFVFFDQSELIKDEFYVTN